VEDRVTLLFADLAERCGRVTADGVVVDVELIGRMVAAQRPTVTLALQMLAERGTLLRAGNAQWLVPRDAGA